VAQGIDEQKQLREIRPNKGCHVRHGLTFLTDGKMWCERAINETLSSLSSLASSIPERNCIARRANS
jgi:hypothetical protein